MRETDPTANDSLAAAADGLLADAADQGDPIEAKPGRRGPGRPSNVELAERERTEKEAARRASDEERAQELFNGLMALAAKKPVQGISEKLGGKLGVDDEETDLVAEAAELWIRNRVGVVLEGDKLFDYLFFGAIAFVFGRRVLAWAIITRMKRNKLAAPVQKNDDTHPGDEALREIDSGAPPGQQTQTTPNN